MSTLSSIETLDTITSPATLASMPTQDLAEFWQDVKRDETAAGKMKKAAENLRGKIAAECDVRLVHGDIVRVHGEQVGAVRPLVDATWNVSEYPTVKKAAVLDALIPFLTPELRAICEKLSASNMVDGVEQNKNVTHVRKLSFK